VKGQAPVFEASGGSGLVFKGVTFSDIGSPTAVSAAIVIAQGSALVHFQDVEFKDIATVITAPASDRADSFVERRD
jgi:hypothetical protein